MFDCLRCHWSWRQNASQPASTYIALWHVVVKPCWSSNLPALAALDLVSKEALLSDRTRTALFTLTVSSLRPGRGASSGRWKTHALGVDWPEQKGTLQIPYCFPPIAVRSLGSNTFLVLSLAISALNTSTLAIVRLLLLCDLARSWHTSFVCKLADGVNTSCDRWADELSLWKLSAARDISKSILTTRGLR